MTGSESNLSPTSESAVTQLGYWPTGCPEIRIATAL